MTTLRGNIITLVGLGKESVALARFADAEGANAIYVTDTQPAERLAGPLAELADLTTPVRYFLGGNDPAAWREAAIIFVSPGISPGFVIKLPGIAEAEQRGAIISNHTQLFFERCPAPIIGITGSSGKTTTTNVIHEMLQASNNVARPHGPTPRRVWMGGNMGVPLINAIGDITSADIVVLEISEVQLARLHASPHIGVITNITPDHLDRYGSFEEYIRAKRQIVRDMHSTDYAILNLDNEPSRASAHETTATPLYFSRTQPVTQGADIRDDAFWLRLPGRAPERICGVAEMRLIGPHNEENMLAAAIASAVAGADTTAIATVIRAFAGVAHRLQHVAERRGVRYYDDSIATSPTRMMAALRTFGTASASSRQTDGMPSVLLIAGGKDKDLPWEEAAAAIVRTVRVVAVLGVSAPKILSAIASAQSRIPIAEQQLERVEQVSTIEAAVSTLATAARPGDVVLLSPGCTSHDMFHGYEERGKHFSDAVANLPT